MQRCLNMLGFDFFQRQLLIRRESHLRQIHLRFAGCDVGEHQIVGFDLVRVRQHNCPFDRIPQFAHIAWPAIGHERRQSSGRKARDAPPRGLVERL